MAKIVQVRRGTTAALSSVTGAEGELFVDTDKETLTVHNNYQAGGFPLLREDLNNLAANSVAVSKLQHGSGTADQVVKVNAAANGLEIGTLPTEMNKLGLIEYQDTAAQFKGLNHFGHGTGDRVICPFNTVFDPYNIFGTTGSNVFQVNTTGSYHVSIYLMKHTLGHHKIYLYNDTDSAFVPRPTAALTGAETFAAPLVSYNVTQGYNANDSDVVYLQTGKNYSIRSSNDNSQTFSVGTSYLYGNYADGGITSRNTVLRAAITKLAEV
jgi:hypothetical protein